MNRSVFNHNALLRISLVVRCCFALLVCSASAEAQEPKADRVSHAPWPVINAIGYGGVGFGLALANEVNSNHQFHTSILVIAGSGALGVGAGIVLGINTNNAIAERGIVPIGLRAASLAGSVLAGATLGTLVYIPLIDNSSEARGKNKRTFRITTGTGAAVGALFAASQYRGLTTARRVAVAPYYKGQGAAGLRITMTF